MIRCMIRCAGAGKAIRRAGAALAAALLGWALLAGPAAASAQGDPVFDPGAAQQLADLLAEAATAQQVCYGWRVRIADGQNRTESLSTGSNFGPGRAVTDAGAGAGRSCRYVVEFTADIVYTSASSELNDSASWAVTSSSPRGPGTADLDRLELFDEGDLVGEYPDVAVSRALAALPQLAANAGLAAPLTAAPATSAPPDAGSLADDPGADYLRRAGGLLAIGAVLLAGGIAFGVHAVRSSRAEQARRSHGSGTAQTKQWHSGPSGQRHSGPSGQ